MPHVLKIHIFILFMYQIEKINLLRYENLTSFARSNFPLSKMPWHRLCFVITKLVFASVIVLVEVGTRLSNEIIHYIKLKAKEKAIVKFITSGNFKNRQIRNAKFSTKSNSR